MLTPNRRHLATCDHRDKGRNFTLCACPIWTDGKLRGARYRKSLDTTSWERALQRIQILEAGGDLAPDIAATSPTVAQAVAAYLKDCRRRNLQDETLRSYTNTLNNVVARLGRHTVAAISLETLDDDGRTLAPRTRRKEIEHIRVFFSWCLDRDWCRKNPAKRLRAPIADDVATMPYTDDEIAALIRACDTMESTNPTQTDDIRRRARALVYMLLYSGLRISDVAKHRRDALDPATGHLTLRIMKTRVPLKILLHKDAQRALLALPSDNPEYFFWTGRGRLIHCTKNLCRTIRRLGEIAGIHAHAHRFRDTFAVELLTQGVDIRQVQLLLGHKSLRTTEKHYAHFVPAHQDRLDSAAATLNFSKTGRPVLMRSPKKRLRNA
jgi:integrase/recombinase XerD